jgi:hypothetical protein
MNSHFNNTRPANAPAATLLEVITDYRRHLIVERTYAGHILGPDPPGLFTPWMPPTPLSRLSQYKAWSQYKGWGCGPS